VCANVHDLGREGGSALNRTSTNKKQFELRESVLESDTPLPTSRLQNILRFGRTFAGYGPDVRGGGGCLPNERCWTGGLA